MRVRVDVMLKDGVLDPQGKAIGHALANQGFQGVDNVRMGKVIEFDLDAPNADRAKDMAKGMAEKLLANLVIEDFRVEIL